MDIKVNYAGITRRVIAGVIDSIITFVIALILDFVLIIIFAVAFESNELGKDSLEMALDFFESNTILLINYAFFIILETLMIIRFSGTPGQLLCIMHIKDVNTLKNVTTMQAVIRGIFSGTFTWIIFLLTGYIGLTIAILLAILLAIFDKRKQFFHDKIAGTVVIDYRALS